MAVDFFNSEEEKDEDQIAQPKSELSSDAGIISGNNPAQQDAGSDKKSASGSFTNLQSYLDANKDQKFGTQVAEKVSDTIGGAAAQQSTARDQFKSAADKSAIKKDEALISDAISKPQEVVANVQRADQFAKMRDAKYTGPRAFADAGDIYNPAQQATEQAYQTADVTKDADGRKAYLQQEYGAKAGRYNYTRGQQKLDNFLIEKDPEAYGKFQENTAKGHQVKRSFDDLSSYLNQYGSERANETEDTRRSTRGALGLNEDSTLNDSSPIMKKLAEAKARALGLNTKRDEEYNAFKAASSNKRQFTDAQLAELGLSRGQQLFGIDPTDPTYMSKGADLDYNTAATPEEAAQVAALSKLAGVQNSYLPYQDKAGKYNPNDFVTANTGNLAAQIAAKKAAYQDELNNSYESFAPGTFGAPSSGDYDTGGVERLTLLPAIERAKARAADAADALRKYPGGVEAAMADRQYYGGVMGPKIMQYQELVNRLKEIQGRHHAEDIAGGGEYADSYSKLPSYLDTLRPEDRARYQ